MDMTISEVGGGSPGDADPAKIAKGRSNRMAQADSSLGRRTAQYLPAPPNDHLDAPQVAAWLVGSAFSVLTWTAVTLVGRRLLLHASRRAEADDRTAP